MNEQNWPTSTDLEAMLISLRGTGRATDRKLRLFAVACCRRLWHLMSDERSRGAVEVAERFADGLASAEQLEYAAEAATTAVDTLRDDDSDTAYYAAVTASFGAAGPDYPPDKALSCALYGSETAGEGGPAEQAAQAALLRDIFGNPFRPPPPLDPSLLQWNGRTAKRLAEDAYEQRLMPAGTLDNARLAVLADALLDAGCQDEELLQHLRGEGPHWRGCWALDVVLGRS